MQPPVLETIECRVEDRVLEIRLNRPDRMNAFTGRMMHDLIAAFDHADANDDVRAVIVTGTGRAFCAGADLEKAGGTFDYRASEVPIDEHRDGGGRVALRVFESRKPVIAAINGPAVGVGITMTLPMDVRLAAAGAKIGFVFARRGIAPEACSTWFLPRLVGPATALEWVMSGRVFSAEEAERRGLVSRVLPPEELLPAARALAREIAENTSGISVALSRQMLWRGLGMSHPMEAHRVESKAIFAMGASRDAAEGVTAFLQKRPANFPMRVSTDMPSFFPWWKDLPFADPEE